ncbi:NADH-quinone oxidoreductase subunit C [Kribbella sp. NBC_01245]|uniref:NADH-quinone oxidoreductase subunit C n=1 Tax=Kribbella sp. NBC_01245 TaxID=2903578 RepID=UPI002E2A85E5|nr:NADH-quinone oxidoreductase subunit C [Kribbella sp. NBC_01245]
MTADAVAQATSVLAEAGITASPAESFGPGALDVPVESWVRAHELLRDEVGLTFFDFLTASDELADGFRIVTHLADFWGGLHVEHVLLRTLIPRTTPRLASLTGVYAGADWHERETFEMFGIDFEGHPNLIPLLLPDGFEGNPLRKEFILASRVAKPWPGAKEPGESDHATPPAPAAAAPRAEAPPAPAPAAEAGTPTPAAPAAEAGTPSTDAAPPARAAKKAGAPSRRRTLPPGVPDPENWGPRPPGSPDPDPLAAAQASAAPARPRRTAGERRAPGERRTAKTTEAPPPPETPPTEGDS